MDGLTVHTLYACSELSDEQLHLIMDTLEAVKCIRDTELQTYYFHMKTE